MSPADPPATAPVSGFYGKSPAAGDFIGRGLPRELVRRWDRWMELALGDALATGGGGGRWRFVAAAGVFGPWPVSGAFALSRDRVDRRFPFLVALPGIAADWADPWFPAAEALLAEALSGTAGPDALAEAAARLPGPHAAQPVPGAAAFAGPAAEPLVFESLERLAEDGLARLFAAGGPDEGGPGGAETFDAEAAARLAAAAPGALPVDEADRVDLDDLLADAGLDAAAREAGDAAPGCREPEGSPDLPAPSPIPFTSDDDLADLLPPDRPGPQSPYPASDAPAGPPPAEDLGDLLPPEPAEDRAPAPPPGPSPDAPPAEAPAPSTPSALGETRPGASGAEPDPDPPGDGPEDLDALLPPPVEDTPGPREDTALSDAEASILGAAAAWPMPEGLGDDPVAVDDLFDLDPAQPDRPARKPPRP